MIVIRVKLIVRLECLSRLHVLITTMISPDLKFSIVIFSPDVK